MESQYQRSKIQEESMHYEHLKHSGQLPIIGVNTYQNPETLKDDYEREEIDLIRASYKEKDDQLGRIGLFKKSGSSGKDKALEALAKSVIEEKNVFAELMHTVRFCSLGEITDLLYDVGGKYRRSM